MASHASPTEGHNGRRRRMYRSFGATMAVAVAAAACGGGGDGAASLASQAVRADEAASASQAPSTKAQVSALAARTANALFAYDEAASLLLEDALSSVPVVLQSPAKSRSAVSARTLWRAHAVPAIISGGLTDYWDLTCFSGSAQIYFVDADSDNELSVGDHGTVTAHHCRPLKDSAWVYSGRAELKITSGTNVTNHLYYLDPGSAVIQMTAKGLVVGDKRRLSGRYVLSSSATVANERTQEIRMPKLRVSAGSASVLFSNVDFVVKPGSLLTDASGSITASVPQIGRVAMSLGVLRQLNVAGSENRFRPQSGTLRLDHDDFRLDAVFGKHNTLSLREDNGKDGNIDVQLRTTAGALDKLLVEP